MERLGALARLEQERAALDALKAEIAEKSSQAEGWERELADLEKEIWKQAGEEFNVNSPVKLGAILFE